MIAGETVEIEVTATAPIDEEQEVRLTARGGPFELAVSPATFTPDNEDFLEDPVVKTFTWNTTCEHISDQFYQVVFKATDNFFDETSGLATLKSVRIKVVGPPPEDLRAEPGSGMVELNWELPYVCENAADDYFRGFTVWRREGSNSFEPDTCMPGLAGRGYAKLNNVAMADIVDGRYYYLDEDVERGRTYCYRILAEFAQTTPAGQYTYNVVESLPSKEVCAQLARDIPLITHVNVLQTDVNEGQMEVCWSKPKSIDLDTLQNPGPYRYEILRADGITINENEFVPIGISFESEFFANANDTCFVDAGLNTSTQPYSYMVNFYVDTDNRSEPLGATNPASSVFLSIEPTDNTNILSWEEEVPWENSKYTIFRLNPVSGAFDSITTVAEPIYRDEGLINGRDYCYKVRSYGTYNVEGVLTPLLNFSQEDCSVPIDNVAPCPPTLLVDNVCDQAVRCTDEELLINTMRWENPMDLCEETDDVVAYYLYYTPVEGGEFERISTIDDPNRLFL